jgi:S1-C subfamily serine protease
MVAIVLALGLGTYHQAVSTKLIEPTTTQELAETSVKIMNLKENGGGSGVILNSDETGSEILTNRHVCEVAEKGGVVVSRKGKHKVIALKKSEQHDLCLVKIKENLKIRTEVSKKAPEFGDAAIISGHPRLYPHTVSRGTFGDRMEVEIVVDVRPCTKEEFEEHGFQCLFGFPVTKKYDSQHTSALVLPGNSGSAVFDSEGHIAGLVFASGSRELHYGVLVPQQYVKFFVDVEAPVKPYEPIQQEEAPQDEQGAE